MSAPRQWFNPGDSPVVARLIPIYQEIEPSPPCHLCHESYWFHGAIPHSDGGKIIVCPGMWVDDEGTINKVIDSRLA